MVAVLFVCLGNICRSPAGEGVLKHIIETNPQFKTFNFQVRSCGIGDWHVGELPDERMSAAAKCRGITLSSRAQQFKKAFFEEFDYILAADREVINDLFHYAKEPEHKAKIHLITEFSKSYRGQEIPDPYYQGGAAFDLVLDMLEDSCEGLLEHISKTKANPKN